MKRFVHYIRDDIEEVNGYPRWQWSFVVNGLMKLTALLKAHADLNRRYPEEANEAED